MLIGIICVVMIPPVASAQNHSFPVGAIEGAMDVTPSGAFAYSFALKMPSGIPLQSDLSINLNCNRKPDRHKCSADRTAESMVKTAGYM